MSDPRAIGAPQAWLDYGPAATPAHTGMALSTKVALALSVFVVLFFAQGWASPLVGYTIILDPKWGPFF
ncbi:MAG: hypothetical protein ACXW3D_11450, partial [Caulobacteraceae bacterium]